MPNQRIEGHPLVGTSHIYRPDLPAYDPETDTEPGTVVIANGFTVEVLAVFKNWNDVAGLDMLAVHCPETGLSTHVTPSDLSLPALA